MTSLWQKLALAAVAAGLTGALLYTVYEPRKRPPVVELLPESSLSAGSRDWRPPLDAAAAKGTSVLDAELPVFPPSAFVRKPWRGQLFSRMKQLSMPDPFVHFRYKPNLSLAYAWPEHPDGEWILRTNSFGMREDDEPFAGRPDLRVLVAGDSHTDGVCNNDESYANLLEARLQSDRPGQVVEVLNAGRGGYSVYHYLGTLERFLHLQPDVFVVAVYGGNDFDGVLTFFHDFNGTVRPPGKELYGDLISEAAGKERFVPALAQSLLSLKYFDEHPDQKEVALQAVRDVSTEIMVTCMRHSIHPIFIYIPSVPESEWDANSEVFRELADLIEVSPEGLLATERMADSYVAFLQERRVDVIDMRAAFERAGPGNFWLSDHHINLRGQRLIAEELHPLVVAARPLGFERTRRAPTSRGLDDATAMLSPGSGAEALEDLELSKPVSRVRFEEALVEKLIGERPHTVLDPLAGYLYAPNLDISSAELGLAGPRFAFITNGLGLREEQEAAEETDLRVLITGDGHVSGACQNAEAFGNLVEAELGRRHPGKSIETLNAGVVGYTFQNYSGVLKRLLQLKPDVFVMGVSSGSDFLEGLRIDRTASGRDFERHEEKYADQLDTARARSPGAVLQAFASTKHFLEYRLHGRRAYEVARETTRDIQHLCEEHGIELIVLIIPAAPDVEWETHARDFEGLRADLAIDKEQLGTNVRIAEPYLRDLGRIRATVIHLDQVFANTDQQLYRPGDFLINTAAHRLIATELAEAIDGLDLLW